MQTAVGEAIGVAFIMLPVVEGHPRSIGPEQLGGLVAHQVDDALLV
jgi:hypothetical protein